MDALVDYYDAGGRIIFFSFDLNSSYAGHPFADRAGVTLAGSYNIPEPVLPWVATPLFDTPNAVPGITVLSDWCVVDGQYLSPTTAMAAAG